MIQRKNGNQELEDQRIVYLHFDATEVDASGTEIKTKKIVLDGTFTADELRQIADLAERGE